MSAPSKRTCQACQKEFAVESDDITFYEKMRIPAPTWCPECRTVRRMSWRNERSWYRRTCDATGKPVLSMFRQESGYKVYEQNYWRSDAWDPLEYGKDVDVTRPFLTQFGELLKAVPEPNLIQKNLVNSEYSNIALNLKNCYNCIGIDGGEDSAYCFSGILDIQHSFDIYQATSTEYSYELIDCVKSNSVRFAQSCEGCVDSWFLYDCRNCTNCIACVGLRSRQYCILNREYQKEEYEKELVKLDLGSYRKLQELNAKFEELKLRVPRKFATIIKSENVIGDNIRNSRDARGFDIRDNAEHVRYSYRVHHNCSDIWDAIVAWNGAEEECEAMSCSGKRIVYSALIWGGFDVQYSYNCFDCNNIFACVGLRSKSYCILNRQYSKEEYETLLPKIIEHMNMMPYADKQGRTFGYGEFFPPELSPFAYNETIAQEYFPLSKEEVERKGYQWKNPEIRNYQMQIKNDQLPDHIRDVPDAIASQTVECGHKGICIHGCTTAFKIIPEELGFYKKTGIPLPRLCPNCRHCERLLKSNPLRLWHRKCQCGGMESGIRNQELGKTPNYRNTATHFHGDKPCPNEFETSYAPERAEIVYCESCYQSEVL